MKLFIKNLNLLLNNVTETTSFYTLPLEVAVTLPSARLQFAYNQVNAVTHMYENLFCFVGPENF